MKAAGMMKPREMAPGAAAGDTAQGFCVKLSVFADGTYGVSGPAAIPSDEDTGETYDSIGAALKGVLELVKQNPTGGDATQQLEAGYGAR